MTGQPEKSYESRLCTVTIYKCSYCDIDNCDYKLLPFCGQLVQITLFLLCERTYSHRMNVTHALTFHVDYLDSTEKLSVKAKDIESWKYS